MGKKQGKQGTSTPRQSLNHVLTLHEESSGKTHVEASSFLRIQHMQRLSSWVSREAGVGSLGALLGASLATNAESLGIPLDTSTSLCQRCETVLQPGFNCTVRIEKNRKKAKRHKNSNPSCQNTVSYTCHFCRHQNRRWGTGKGVVKSLLSSRIPTVDTKSKTRVATKGELGHRSQVAAAQPESTPVLKSPTPEKDMSSMNPGSEKTKMEEEAIAAATSAESLHDSKLISPEKAIRCEAAAETSKCVTPERNKLKEETDPKNLVTPFRTLDSMSSRKRKKKSASATTKAPASASKSAPIDSGKVTSSSRKRRKGWTSLKQIAESYELERKKKMENFVIPRFK